MTELTVSYGTPGSPGTVDPAAGYSLANFTVYGTPGTGTADALTIGGAIYSRLWAGSRGIAIGVYALAANGGSWSTGGGAEAGVVARFTDGTTTKGGVVFGTGIHANATTRSC